LTNHALGKLKKPLDASQVRAIEILLKKTLPDLTHLDAQVSGTMDLTIEIVKFGGNEKG